MAAEGLLFLHLPMGIYTWFQAVQQQYFFLTGTQWETTLPWSWHCHLSSTKWRWSSLLGCSYGLPRVTITSSALKSKENNGCLFCLLSVQAYGTALFLNNVFMTVFKAVSKFNMIWPDIDFVSFTRLIMDVWFLFLFQSHFKTGFLYAWWEVVNWLKWKM